MANGNKVVWVQILNRTKKPIGAIGILGQKIAAIVAFYKDEDVNKDGKVSWGEWAAFKISPFRSDGMAVAEVVTMAKTNVHVLRLAPNDLRNMSNKVLLSLVSGLLKDGIYAAYFNAGASMICGGVAKKLTSGMIKEFVVQKGLEEAVKKAFRGIV